MPYVMSYWDQIRFLLFEVNHNKIIVSSKKLWLLEVSEKKQYSKNEYVRFNK